LVLLDGGTGREIQDRGLARRGSIWSALALLEAPSVVSDVHQAFVDAGAEVIITNNYSVVPKMLGKEGLEHRFDELTIQCGELAAAVRDSTERSIRVAGSLPPLSISYQPSAVGPEVENVELYRRIANNLNPYVDLFVCETMSTGLEARAAARVAGEFAKPVWVAWTLDRSANGCLRSGETIAQAYDLLLGLRVDAFLFNCASPEAITTAIPLLREITDVPIGAYANAFGERRDDGSVTPIREDLDPDGYADVVLNWRAQGATILGGCCGISPRHIAVLAERLNRAGAS
jgi:homocysteine S-methyltransferase